MASTIAAGTTAGTAIVVSGDTSGSLVLQTNGTTTAVTINTSQNVGIGTSSPATRFDVLGNNTTTSGAETVADFRNGAGGATSTYIRIGNSSYNSGAIGSIVESAGNAALVFNSNTSSVSTERMRIDSAGLLKFNSGYGSVATAYGCRAWVNFNGTGTVAIRASGNVSSITDNGTGDYTVNFTTAMSDANYSTVGTGCLLFGTYRANVTIKMSSTSTPATYTTTAVRINTENAQIDLITDGGVINVSIFR